MMDGKFCSKPGVTAGTRTPCPCVRLFMIRTLVGLMTALMPLFQATAADIYAFIGEGGETLYSNIRTQGSIKVRFPLASTMKKNARGSQGFAAQSASYDTAIFRTSELFAMDPDLVRAVIKVESNYNHRAVSPKGALGLMQLMPGTARDMGVADPFDPAANIHGGVMYLRRLMDAMRGDLAMSLAAYNAGLERVRGKNGIPDIPETRHYVRQVLKNYKKFKKVSE